MHDENQGGNVSNALGKQEKSMLGLQKCQNQGFVTNKFISYMPLLWKAF